jgi:hypothetical protein
MAPSAASADSSSRASAVVAPLLSIGGPLSALAAALAVVNGYITTPTALLIVALLGAAAYALRALAEPAVGLPSWQQAVQLARGRRSIFPRDFTGEGAC